MDSHELARLVSLMLRDVMLHGAMIGLAHVLRVYCNMCALPLLLSSLDMCGCVGVNERGLLEMQSIMLTMDPCRVPQRPPRPTRCGMC